MTAYKYNPKKMGSFIEKCRNTFSLSQADIANELGVTISTVSKWENGSNQPKTEEQVLLANLFKMQVSSFMECLSNDLPVGDLYFESFINDLGNVDFTNATNKKRIITSYIACKQRLNHLVKQYLIEDHKISFQEFERLAKAIKFRADIEDTIIVQRNSEKFDISKFDLKNISFPVGEDGSGGSKEVDMSDCLTVNGIGYEQFKATQESFAYEMKSQGINNWFVQGFDFELNKDNMKAYCTNVAFFSSCLYIKASDLAYIKYCMKIGLPVENIHFYCLDLGKQTSLLIDENYELLKSYLSVMNMREFRLAYAFMMSNHKLTPQEIDVVIRVAGEKTIYGDDMLI